MKAGSGLGAWQNVERMFATRFSGTARLRAQRFFTTAHEREATDDAEFCVVPRSLTGRQTARADGRFLVLAGP